MRYEDLIVTTADFPKPGVLFHDFTPLLQEPGLFRSAVREFVRASAEFGATKIAAIESKGFLLGATIAYEAALPLILIRKPGLTPGAVKSRPFVKEYGEGSYEVKEGAIGNAESVVVVYDILAGPGASLAAQSLVEESGGRVVGFLYVTELVAMRGRDLLVPTPVFSLVQVG